MYVAITAVEDARAQRRRLRFWGYCDARFLSFGPSVQTPPMQGTAKTGCKKGQMSLLVGF